MLDDTRRLIELAQKGDASAKERLVEENSGLIWSVVRKFRGRGCETDDLFQIGAIGLIKCIDKFDPSFDVKFSTYAVPMIMGEIRRFLRDDGMIKVSRPLKETAVKAKFLAEQLKSEKGEEPTVGELAERMGIDPETLVEALDSSRDVESIFRTVCGNDGSTVYLIDRLSGGDMEDIADGITLRQMISDLEPKERQLIFLRYFKDRTQSETAKEIGLSQVQVSRMEKKIINRLRDSFGT